MDLLSSHSIVRRRQLARSHCICVLTSVLLAVLVLLLLTEVLVLPLLLLLLLRWQYVSHTVMFVVHVPVHVPVHGQMVAPHGAGLTNILFGQPGGALIELYPYHMHHLLYTTIAANAGLATFPVHSVWR